MLKEVQQTRWSDTGEESAWQGAVYNAISAHLSHHGARGVHLGTRLITSHHNTHIDPTLYVSN